MATKSPISDRKLLKEGKHFSLAATVVDLASYWMTYPALLFASETLSSLYVARKVGRRVLCLRSVSFNLTDWVKTNETSTNDMTPAY